MKKIYYLQAQMLHRAVNIPPRVKGYVVGVGLFHLGAPIMQCSLHQQGNSYIDLASQRNFIVDFDLGGWGERRIILCLDS
jgi:hypothetical protein